MHPLVPQDALGSTVTVKLQMLELLQSSVAITSTVLVVLTRKQ